MPDVHAARLRKNRPGTAGRIDATQSLIDIVARTAARFETEAGSDWSFDPADPRERVQVRGIIGFRMQVREIAIKYKLNQNHPLANRVSVAERLSGSAREREREIAAMMQASFHDTSRED